MRQPSPHRRPARRTTPGLLPSSRADRRGGRGPGFTMLELHVAIAILAIGLLGLGSLMVRQSRQVSRLERWCVPDRTYHVVVQTDPWMRLLEAPADLREGPDQAAWSPPVSADKDYAVTVLSQTRVAGSSAMSAQVEVHRIGGGGG